MTERKLFHEDPWLQAGRLECDNPICDYVQPHGERLNEAMIGRPCPKCGVSLCTQKDYDDCVSMLKVAEKMERLFGPDFGSLSSEETSVINIKVHNGAHISEEKQTND